MSTDLDSLLEDIGKANVRMLLMEDIIEQRIQIDKDVSEDDWQDFYDGECLRCERLWEADFMMPFGTQKYCIPCWRKNNDLPKLDPDNTDLKQV